MQDLADKGLELVGLLQQPGGGPYFPGHWDPEELSSLHSSPSPIHSQSELIQPQANQPETTSPDMSPPDETRAEMELRRPSEQESYKPEQGGVEMSDPADLRNGQHTINTHNTPPAQANHTHDTHAHTLNNNNELLKRPEDCDQTAHSQNRKCVLVHYITTCVCVSLCSVSCSVCVCELENSYSHSHIVCVCRSAALCIV